ncbi:MAG: permease [Acidimicrobiia bacterium]|nr:permease [Acidimicrobiia bacterium]
MIGSTVFLVVELIVLFLGVAFGVELLQRRLGPDRLKAWMGGAPVTAALKGIVVGFVTPFCTYSAVPLLIGLRRAGVPAAGYVAFIVAAPVLDPVLFGALTLIVGLDVAIAYLAVAFSAALTLALVAERVGIDRYLKPLPTTRSLATVTVGAPASATTTTTTTTEQCSGDGADHHPWRDLNTETADAARSAGALFRSFGPLLALGVAVGLAIEAFVSPDTAARITGDNSTLAIPIAASLGTPLYFSTELFIPISDALKDAGVGTGAIVALTIAGAGANVPEFIILTRLAQRRLVAILFAYVFAIAALGGFLAQAISA